MSLQTASFVMNCITHSLTRAGRDEVEIMPLMGWAMQDSGAPHTLHIQDELLLKLTS